MPANLIDRARNVILTPKSEWTIIDGEETTTAELFRSYIAILAAIPVLARLLRGFVFGYSLGPLGTMRIGFFGGIGGAIVHYLLSLAIVYAASLIVSYLAPNFGGLKDDLKALKLTAYSYTPAWVAGVFGLIPGIHFLGILGLWSLYVFFVGAPQLLKIPPEKAAIFTGAVVVATIVLALALSAVVHLLVAAPGFGYM